MNLNIEKITVITGSGEDKIAVYVSDFKEATWPYKSVLKLHFSASEGMGAEYVRTNFGIDPVVIHVSEKTKT